MYNRANCVIFNCIFSGNAANQGGGMYTYAGSPKLTNCTLSGNLANGSGGGLYVRGDGGNPKLTNCILWSNVDSGGVDESAQAHVNYTYESVTTFNFCCIQGWTGNLVGISNIDADPCFADPCDYHLISAAGRWNPNSQTWVTDTNTSPCIDAGDPDSPIGLEPFPNGGRVNMGAYGGTAEASKSYFGGPICEIIVAGDVNGDCVVDGKDLAIMALHWLVNNNP